MFHSKHSTSNSLFKTLNFMRLYQQDIIFQVKQLRDFWIKIHVPPRCFREVNATKSCQSLIQSQHQNRLKYSKFLCVCRESAIFRVPDSNPKLERKFVWIFAVVRTAATLEKKLVEVIWRHAMVTAHPWAFCSTLTSTSGDSSHSGVMLTNLSHLLSLPLHCLDFSFHWIWPTLAYFHPGQGLFFSTTVVPISHALWRYKGRWCQQNKSTTNPIFSNSLAGSWQN